MQPIVPVSANEAETTRRRWELLRQAHEQLVTDGDGTMEYSTAWQLATQGDWQVSSDEFRCFFETARACGSKADGTCLLIDEPGHKNAAVAAPGLGMVRLQASADVWRVIGSGGAAVRVARNADARQLGVICAGTCVRAFEVDGWLRLADGPGFVPMELNSQPMVVRLQAPPPLWRVGDGAPVRAEPRDDSRLLPHKTRASALGFEVDGWLQLEGEPGFISLTSGPSAQRAEDVAQLWSVVFDGPVPVHSASDVYSKVLGERVRRAELLRAYEVPGGWIRLVDEPGHIAINSRTGLPVVKRLEAVDLFRVADERVELRADRSPESKPLAQRVRGDLVPGLEADGWIRVADEPGFVQVTTMLAPPPNPTAGRLAFHDILLFLAPPPIDDGRGRQERLLPLMRLVRQACPDGIGRRLYRARTSSWRELLHTESILALDDSAGDAQLWVRSVRTELGSGGEFRTLASYTVRRGRFESVRDAFRGASEKARCVWRQEFFLKADLAEDVPGAAWSDTRLKPVQDELYMLNGQDGGAVGRWVLVREGPCSCGIPQVEHLGLSSASMAQLETLLAEDMPRADSEAFIPSASMLMGTPTGSHLDLAEVPHSDSHGHRSPALCGGELLETLETQQAATRRVDSKDAASLDEVWRWSHDSWPRRGLRRYSALVVQCPWCLMGVYMVCLIIIVGALWRPLDLELDFASFMKADGHAQLRSQAFALAKEGKKNFGDRRRLQEVPTAAHWDLLDERFDDSGVFLHEGSLGSDDGRRLQFGNYFKITDLEFAYAAVDGNAMEERVLRDIKDFEAALRSLPGWVRTCSDAGVTLPHKCDPGETFSSIAWPTLINDSTHEGAFELRFDGSGSDTTKTTLPTMLTQLKLNTSRIQGVGSSGLWFPASYVLPPISTFMDSKHPWDGVGPASLRTRFTFELLVKPASESMSAINAAAQAKTAEFNDFVQKEIYPFLLKTPETYRHIRIYYRGAGLYSFEVKRTLFNDLLWAVGAVFFVFFYTWLHSRSFLVTCGGMLVIFLSIPLAYVLTPATKTTLASFLAVFLITGIGVDSLFVFCDFWEQSERLKEVDTRLVFVYIHAGKSCLATSITTAVSFLANIASVLQPLREFGLFMGICVLSSFVLMWLFVPPLIWIKDRRRRKIRTKTIDVSVKQTVVDSSNLSSIVPLPNADDKNMMNLWGARSTGRLGQPAGRNDKGKSEEMRTKMAKRRYALLFNLGTCTNTFPLTILGVGVLLTILSVIGLAVTAKMDTSLPTIFPSDHNQVAGKALFEKFQDGIPVRPSEPPTETVCEPDAENAERCMFHWCRMVPDLGGADTGASGAAPAAECWRGQVQVSTVDNTTGIETWSDNGYEVDGCTSISVRSRVMAARDVDASEWITPWKAASKTLLGLTTGWTVSDVSWPTFNELSPLSLEEWETGNTLVHHLYDTTSVSFAPTVPDDTTNITTECRIHTVCTMSSSKCVLPGLRRAGSFNLATADATAASPSSSASRRLVDMPENWVQSPRVVLSKRAYIRVVYGIRAPLTQPVVGAQPRPWSYDPTFLPSNPWSQRAMLAMCNNVAPELRVIQDSCWIREFQSWLSYTQWGDDKRFPTRKFDELVYTWYSNRQTYASLYLWVNSYKVVATFFTFQVDVPSDIAALRALDYKAQWDAYVDVQNAAAGGTGNRAFHISDLWTRAEAEIAIISSTTLTIILSTVWGAVGVLLFTADLWLTLFVVGVVISVMAVLGAFMTVIMGWAIGPIEVIALVVFVGYSVTYSLHVAHDYSRVSETDSELKHAQAWALRKAGVANDEIERRLAEPLPPSKLRRERSRVAVLRMGGATLSSALSTVGTSVFLLFCTMSIFVKLGVVVIAVTVISNVAALVTLPALLSVAGPGPTPLAVRIARALAKRVMRLVERYRGAAHRQSTAVGLLHGRR